MNTTLLMSILICAAGPLHAAENNGLPYTPSLDPAAMDRTIDPCTNFYLYSCGGWKKNNPLPGDKTAWSVYGKLAEENMAGLRGLLERAAIAKSRDAVQARIGDYYASCMDEAGVDAAGAVPLKADIDLIGGLTDVRSLATLLGNLKAGGRDGALLFGAAATQDPDDSDSMIPEVDQGGLGLPDRDYYVKVDSKSVEIRGRYVGHVAKIFSLLGDGEGESVRHAQVVMRLETDLAKASQTKVERRDPYNVTHKMTLAELQTLAPNLDWSAFVKTAGIPGFKVLNVASPGFLKELSARLPLEPVDDWRTLLRFHVANSDAPYLSKAFVEENFSFYKKYLRGAKELSPRWKRCVQYIDEQLGEDLGQLYVREFFPRSALSRTKDMVERIEEQMKRRLNALDWMGPETKKAALAKLRTVRNKVGYPDHWRDYSSLKVSPKNFAENVRAGRAFEARRDLTKIGRPVDRGEWQMTPPTVNAYFDAHMNDINFPAGVLQPPLFDAKLDDAPNYGNTGGTIGHELTHGFDDEGRQFDAKGNLKNWWSKEDADRFVARAKCVQNQYAGYIAIDDIHINSELTLGEDVADLGGEVLAYQAWKDATKGKKLADADGLSPDQRFFVGFAQWACENATPEQERDWALTNPHSPARYRINGVVVNMPEFAKAFSCKEGAPMTKPAGQACVVW